MAPTFKRRRPEHALAAALGLCLLWAYVPTFLQLWQSWSNDPRYSHGCLVPGFALVLLWTRRHRLSGAVPAPGIGLLLVAAGATMRLAAARYYYGWVGPASLLPSLAGVCALAGGRVALRWAWPSIAFLLFMIPLPFRVEQALGSPTQRLATVASTFALQTLGLDAVDSGNTIKLGDFTLGIVDACNGLGLSYMCLACAVGATLVVRRPLLDKLLLVASAVPLALLANVTRITVTGLLHETTGKWLADAVYHDLAGWLMMPLVLVAMSAELRLISFLFNERDAPSSAPSRPAVDGLAP
jgi:exosortase